MLKLTKISLLTAASISIATLGVRAADVTQPMVVPEAQAVPSFDWSGFYAGLHAGYGSADRDWNGEIFGFPLPDEPFQYDMNGALVGAQVGYNWQMNNFVLGVEADAAWSSMDDEKTELGSDVVSEVEWLATIRGRAGFAWNRLLVYGTGGVAFAGVDTNVSSVFNDDSASATHTGWTAGVGLEAMVTQRLSLKVEYLHADFGSQDYDYDLIPFGSPSDETTGSADLKIDTVRVGLNYHF